MCIRLFMPDGSVITSLDELDQLITYAVPLRSGFSAAFLRDDDACLCPVDINELERRTGWRIEGDGMDLTVCFSTLPAGLG